MLPFLNPKKIKKLLHKNVLLKGRLYNRLNKTEDGLYYLDSYKRYDNILEVIMKSSECNEVEVGDKVWLRNPSGAEVFLDYEDKSVYYFIIDERVIDYKMNNNF